MHVFVVILQPVKNPPCGKCVSHARTLYLLGKDFVHEGNED